MEIDNNNNNIDNNDNGDNNKDNDDGRYLYHLSAKIDNLSNVTNMSIDLHKHPLVDKRLGVKDIHTSG